MELKVTPMVKGIEIDSEHENGLGKNSVRNFIFNFLKKNKSGNNFQW